MVTLLWRLGMFPVDCAKFNQLASRELFLGLQRTIDAIKAMLVDKVANLVCKRPSGCCVCCEGRKLGATVSTSQRNHGLDMLILALQLRQSCQTASFAVGLLREVCPLIEMLVC